MTVSNDHKSLGHPLGTGSFSNTLALFREDGGPDPEFRLRAMSILASNILCLPFRRREIRKWAARIAETRVVHPPIFIIGIWRSGTTHLHSMLACDARLGVVSTLQAFGPDLCLEHSRLLMPIFRRLLPEKRPMDNVVMDVTYPEEDEHAVGNISPYSFYHGLYLPRTLRARFDRLSFGEEPSELKETWKRLYLHILQKATLVNGGKRLVLKNPACTCRIPAILEMFPEARFVFLYRDPHVVFCSLRHFFTCMIRAYQLQRVSDEEIRDAVFHVYERMIWAYWNTKPLIPAGHVVEVRFEDLEADPMGIMEGVYRELEIEDFAGARAGLTEYLRSHADYKKNCYSMSPAIAALVSERWHEAIHRFGYAGLGRAPPASPGR